jgi:thioredoxin 1
MSEDAQRWPRVVDATPETVRELLAVGNDALALLYLWGPNCPNCDFFAKRLPNLLDQLDGERLRLVKVNAYQHPELAREYGVFGIPHFVLFKAGRRIGKMSEFKGDAFWLAVVREHLAAPA